MEKPEDGWGAGAVPPIWSDEVAQQMWAFLGRWIVLQDGEIVAAADTLDEALDTALADGATRPVVYRVPSHPEYVAAYRAQPIRS
jgi:hypothetical protein